LEKVGALGRRGPARVKALALGAEAGEHLPVPDALPDPPPDFDGTEVAPVRVLFVGAGSDLAPSIAALRQRSVHVADADDLESIAREVTSGGAPPDCVVFDLRAGTRVRDACAWYCRNVSRLVLVLTAPADVRSRIECLRLDVADHAVAPFDPKEIVARVERLGARQRITRRSRIDAGDLVIDIDQRTVARSGTSIDLTPRELDVLMVLVRNRGRTFSKQALLEQVWHGAPRTANVVEATVSSLRRKLHVGGPPVIHTLHRAGYTFRPVVPSTAPARANGRSDRERLVRERDEAVARLNEAKRQLRRIANDDSRG
jgi:two-component system OmpR family response regulator